MSRKTQRNKSKFASPIIHKMSNNAVPAEIDAFMKIVQQQGIDARNKKIKYKNNVLSKSTTSTSIPLYFRRSSTTPPLLPTTVQHVGQVSDIPQAQTQVVPLFKITQELWDDDGTINPPTIIKLITLNTEENDSRLLKHFDKEFLPFLVPLPEVSNQEFIPPPYAWNYGPTVDDRAEFRARVMYERAKNASRRK